MAAPEFVADDRYGLSPRDLVFFRQKRPAARHGDPEHVKIVAGYVLAENTLDMAVRLQLQTRSGKGNQTRERVILVSIVREGRIRRCVADKMRGNTNRVDQHELAWVLYRQRTDQELIRNAKDRRVRTNAERQRENYDGREARLTQQAPNSVADVLN